jgi:predicted MFS family arabinose efflux permease
VLLGLAELAYFTAVGVAVYTLPLYTTGPVGSDEATPAFFSAIFATASPPERGAAAGTASVFIDLGLGFGPICLGLVARSGGIPAALLAGAGIAVLGAVWVGWLSTRSSRPDPVIMA